VASSIVNSLPVPTQQQLAPEPLKGHEIMPSDDDKMQYAEYASKNWSEAIRASSQRRRLMKAAQLGRETGTLDEAGYKKAVDLFGEQSDTEQDIRRQMDQYRKTGKITEKASSVDERGNVTDTETDVLTVMKKKKKK